MFEISFNLKFTIIFPHSQKELYIREYSSYMSLDNAYQNQKIDIEISLDFAKHTLAGEKHKQTGFHRFFLFPDDI